MNFCCCTIFSNCLCEKLSNISNKLSNSCLLSWIEIRVQSINSLNGKISSLVTKIGIQLNFNASKRVVICSVGWWFWLVIIQNFESSKRLVYSWDFPSNEHLLEKSSKITESTHDWKISILAFLWLCLFKCLRSIRNSSLKLVCVETTKYFRWFLVRKRVFFTFYLIPIFSYFWDLKMFFII